MTSLPTLAPPEIFHSHPSHMECSMFRPLFIRPARFMLPTLIFSCTYCSRRSWIPPSRQLRTIVELPTFDSAFFCPLLMPPLPYASFSHYVLAISALGLSFTRFYYSTFNSPACFFSSGHRSIAQESIAHACSRIFHLRL
jgi:hypothetical protein